MKQFFSLAITLCILPLHAGKKDSFEKECAFTARNLQHLAEHRIEQCERASNNTPLHDAIINGDIDAARKALDVPPGLGINPWVVKNNAQVSPQRLLLLRALATEKPSEYHHATRDLMWLAHTSMQQLLSQTHDDGAVSLLEETTLDDDDLPGIDVDPWYPTRDEFAQQTSWLDDNWSASPPGD